MWNFWKVNKYNYNKDIRKMFKLLRKLRLKNGFYIASAGEQYQYTWLRDNFYCSLPELWHSPKKYLQTYHTWLDYYKTIEKTYNKFSSLIEKGRLDYTYEFPHIKLNPDLTEMSEGWNHLQIDTIGYFLLGLAKCFKNKLPIIRDNSDLEIIQKVIGMLYAIKYWELAEAGAWEENNEHPRASSIGCVVAGLQAISNYVHVPNYLINNGKQVLRSILPNETPTRKYDLAQLFLIYPCDILLLDMENTILHSVETYLLKERGVIRYLGDNYYNYRGEAEWTFGLAYLGIIYYHKKDYKKAKKYYDKIISNASNYKIPELYYSKTITPNNNTPLGWALALTIELAHLLNKL